MIPAILIATGILVGGTALALFALRVLTDQNIDRVWELLEAEPTGDVFEEDSVDDLPSPARRYFLNAIEPGALVPATATMQMSGSIRLRPDSAWLPFTARQIVCALRGFVWQAQVGAGFTRVSGADVYAGRTGCSRFWLWRILPVACRRGSDVARAAVGRLAIESIFLPSALLPSNGVRWEAVRDDTADATLEIDGENITLTLKVGPDGALRQVSMLRWRPRTCSGPAGYFPFGIDVHEEAEVGGYTVPVRFAASWNFGADDAFEYLRCTVDHIEFA